MRPIGKRRRRRPSPRRPRNFTPGVFHKRDMKILVVDDDRVSRKKLEVILSPFGRVETSDGGTRGVEAFRRAWESWQPFDLICLDVDMPEVNGYEALQRIREVERERRVAADKQVKVMMVTGSAGRDVVLFCRREGCNEYVIKPFTREVIVSKLLSMGFPLSGINAPAPRG